VASFSIKIQALKRNTNIESNLNNKDLMIINTPMLKNNEDLMVINTFIRLK